jgi:hypothetical protein
VNRFVTNVAVLRTFFDVVVTLLSIYDKSEVSTLSETQISSLVANYLLQQSRLDES